MQAAIDKIVATVELAGIASGIFALDSANAREYAKAGIKLVAVGADVMWLLRSTRQALQEARL